MPSVGKFNITVKDERADKGSRLAFSKYVNNVSIIKGQPRAS